VGSLRSRTSATVCNALLSWRSPPRFRRWRVCWPDDAGIGQAPASAAKAASERSRPAYDQLTRTCAALIGPTPGRPSSHGASAVTSLARSASSPAASVASVCTGPSGHRALAGGQQHPVALPDRLAGAAWRVARERGFASSADRVERVALAAAAGRPAGPFHLDDPLAAPNQYAGQPGTVAARIFDGEAASAGDMGAREVEQPLVAGGVGGHDQLPEQATDRRDSRFGQGFAVGVDADDAIDPLSQRSCTTPSSRRCGHCRPGGIPPGEPVMGHNLGAGQAAVSSQGRWCHSRHRHPADNSSPRQPYWRPIRCESCRNAGCRSLTAILQNRSGKTHRGVALSARRRDARPAHARLAGGGAGRDDR
jgi:hypothetical protein